MREGEGRDQGKGKSEGRKGGGKIEKGRKGERGEGLKAGRKREKSFVS